MLALLWGASGVLRPAYRGAAQTVDGGQVRDALVVPSGRAAPQTPALEPRRGGVGVVPSTSGPVVATDPAGDDEHSPPLADDVLPQMSAPASPGVLTGVRSTTSRYVAFLTGDASADIERARAAACSHAGEPAGVVVLALGRQRDGGTQAFGPAGTVRSYQLLTDVVAAYANELVRCAGPGWTVAATTSNYAAVDVAVHARYGTEWAAFVNTLSARVAAETGPGVTVAAGWDLEPAWSTVDVATAWWWSFRSSTDAMMVFNPSADGCGTSGFSECANGWTNAQLARIVWEAPNSIVIPQIYTDSGAQARQWAALAGVAIAMGYPAEFGGVMTQTRACAQRPSAQCLTLDLVPDVALTLLRAYLAVEPSTSAVPVADAATDIGWDA